MVCVCVCVWIIREDPFWRQLIHLRGGKTVSVNSGKPYHSVLELLSRPFSQGPLCQVYRTVILPVSFSEVKRGERSEGTGAGGSEKGGVIGQAITLEMVWKCLRVQYVGEMSETTAFRVLRSWPLNFSTGLGGVVSRWVKVAQGLVQWRDWTFGFCCHSSLAGFCIRLWTGYITCGITYCTDSENYLVLKIIKKIKRYFLGWFSSSVPTVWEQLTYRAQLSMF